MMARMPVGLLNNGKHWQERAEEARVHADQLTDPEAKRMMLGIAQSYDRLAKRAEERQLSAVTVKDLAASPMVRGGDP
jgi:hypothetical protein